MEVFGPSARAWPSVRLGGHAAIPFQSSCLLALSPKNSVHSRSVFTGKPKGYLQRYQGEPITLSAFGEKICALPKNFWFTS